MTWQTRIYILTFGLLLLLSFGILPATQNEFTIFARLVLGIIAISLIVFAILAGLLAREAILTRKAKRVKEEYQARVVDTVHGTWFIAHKDIDVVPLHSTPYLRINGHERDLTPDERFYLASQVPHNRVSDAARLPSDAVQSPLDLLTIFTQPTQSYAIIAGQQVGKTFQARRIAQHWLSTGCKPVIIGPKWDKGEWEGCTLFGGEYNMQQVSRGMQIIKRLVEDRHSNKNLSHKQHAIQPVFFDDWTAIRAHLLDESEAFILDATTLYASVNIILYFIIHLDTANAWGVGKVGAALHQNFYKLFIEPGMNESGLIDRSRNIGYVIYPGQSKKDRKRVALFGGTGNQLLLPDLVIQPNEEAQRIIQMIDNGMSYKDISESIWGTGKFGKFYNEKIDRILSKHTPRDNSRSTF